MMTDSRIESSSRSAEPRTGKVAAQSTGSARAAAGATGDQAQDFSSLLAQLDSFADTGLPCAALQTGDAEDEKLAPSMPSTLAEQDALLAAGGHAPWMSLVGQTARLDAQGDADLRQGAATDFLSGRGSLAQLAHRQALQTAEQGAHAAFMGKDLQSNQPQVNMLQGQSAINSDYQPAALNVALNADGKLLQQDAAQTSLAANVAQASTEVKLEPAVHKLQNPAPQGISLQGMTAVQPQLVEGLRDWLRAARSPLSQQEGTQARAAGARGDTDLQAAAAAVGAAMGAANAGMQSGSQSGSDLAQNLMGQEAAPSEREQEVSEQVAFWVHQKTQNAALSIQHEGRPIQVQVQLNGQQAHVRFAADDEQARQLLADGQAQLGELLQAQGLSLSGVSVDAGGSNAQPGTGGRGEDTPRGAVRAARVTVDAQQLQGATISAGNSAKVSPSGVDLFV